MTFKNYLILAIVIFCPIGTAGNARSQNVPLHGKSSQGASRASLSSTALGILATSMASGTWAELKTQNAGPAFSATGSSGIILAYAQDLRWAPTAGAAGAAYFIGSDHGNPAKFVQYDAKTNAWTVMPRPAWVGDGTMHGNDDTAVNEEKGWVYHRCGSYSNRQPISFCKYDIATGQWSELPPLVTSGFPACCGAAEHFPGLGLVYVLGNHSICKETAADPCGDVFLYNETTHKWTTLSNPGTYPMAYTNFAEYSRVHNVLLFGQGTNLYRLNADQSITVLRPSPVQLAVYYSVVTADPVTGDFLIAASKEVDKFYAYNPLTDVWTEQPGPLPPIFNGTANYGRFAMFNVIGGAVADYGVVMYAKAYMGNMAKVYIYKHASKPR